MPDPRETAADVVVRLLGVSPLATHRTSSPDAWYADLPDGRCVVVKAPGWRNRPGSTRVEAWAYRACAARGVRVPTVLAASDDPESLVLERLPGIPLPTDPARQDRELWARAGEDLRAVHEIRLPGFGPLVPAAAEPRGEADSWCSLADAAYDDGIPRLVDRGVLTVTEADKLRDRIDEARPAFEQVVEGRLLHGDLESGHVFHIAGGDYAGLIDFGQAQAGDPRWDLARIPLWDGETALDALLDGYGRDTVTEADRALLLPIYRLSFAVHHAAGHDNADYVRTLLDRCGYRALL